MKKIELSQQDIDNIIYLYKNEPIGMKAIGEKYNVSREVIKRILIENNVELDKSGQKYKGGKSEADKRFYKKNKTKINNYYREWLKTADKETIKANNKEWRNKNKDKLKEQNRINQKNRLKNNPQYRLSQRFSTAIWQNIKDNGGTKYNKTFNMLPYTFNELKEHLESLFEDGMCWDNYGEWHVDHAIPQSKFKYETPECEEFKLCWALSNLKPMWGNVNCSKNNNYTHLSLDSIKYLLNDNLKGVIEYDDIILSKSYLKAISNAYGKDYIMNYIDDVLKFIRLVSPEFPEVVSNENPEKLFELVKNLNPKDENGDIINSRISPYGNMYLKSIFKSFWGASYKNTKTPREVWLDDIKMRYILKYRLGVNDSNEFFDISLKQIVKGISVNRYSVSFFKPLLAAYIYKSNLGDVNNPTVLDPSAGFGGRLLGFKVVYPNGKYIACEPNKETYNELLVLVDTLKLTNVELHNCKFEDFPVNFDYDFAFTSIPYFDLETYSDPVEYNSFDDWKNTFMSKILSLNNALINLSEEIYNRCELNIPIKNYLINNKNHFTKTNNRELFIFLK